MLSFRPVNISLPPFIKSCILAVVVFKSEVPHRSFLVISLTLLFLYTIPLKIVLFCFKYVRKPKIQRSRHNSFHYGHSQLLFRSFLHPQHLGIVIYRFPFSSSYKYSQFWRLEKWFREWFMKTPGGLPAPMAGDSKPFVTPAQGELEVF